MCGIAGCVSLGSTPIDQQVLQSMFLALEDRGKDACGVALVEPQGVRVKKTAVPSKEAIEAWPSIVDPTPKTSAVLLHTRQATQGSPQYPDNNHPIIGKQGLLIHNGMLTSNTKGYGQSDSGQLLWQIEQDSLEKALTNAHGWLSVAYMDYHQRHLIYLYTDSGLHLGWDAQRQHLYFASTQSLLAKPWKQHFGMGAWGLFPDLQVAELGHDTLVTINTQERTVVASTVEAYGFGNYGPYGGWDDDAYGSYQPDPNGHYRRWDFALKQWSYIMPEFDPGLQDMIEGSLSLVEIKKAKAFSGASTSCVTCGAFITQGHYCSSCSTYNRTWHKADCCCAECLGDRIDSMWAAPSGMTKALKKQDMLARIHRRKPGKPPKVKSEPLVLHAVEPVAILKNPLPKPEVEYSATGARIIRNPNGTVIYHYGKGDEVTNRRLYIYELGGEA